MQKGLPECFWFCKQLLVVHIAIVKNKKALPINQKRFKYCK